MYHELGALDRTLAIAESCTGGSLGGAFTDIAGVSNVSVFADIPEDSSVIDIGCGSGLDSFVASQKTGIKFTRAAFRAIYKYSGGIPRSINIACDRALLTAFSLNRHRISGSIARSAVRESAIPMARAPKATSSFEARARET